MFTEERALWIYRSYRWLEQVLPPRTEPAPLVRLTPEFFPFRITSDTSFATAAFESIKSMMGMSEWPCRLEPEDDGSAAYAEMMHRAGVLGASTGARSPLGTFSVPGEVVITYNLALLKRPDSLIATLAHELCHYLLAGVESPPSEGWNQLEPLTDLAAVHEGFGLFLANTAFSFGQWADSHYHGWSAQTQGYLTEAELGFALAVFCHRTGTPAQLVSRALKPNPGEVFRDALDFVADLDARES